MRKLLAENEGQRKKYTALFSKLGRRVNFHGYSEETLLLKNVVDAETGAVVADHLWFDYTRRFRDAGITVGDTIEFHARIRTYSKGYRNARYAIDQSSTDYKLSNPTRIKIVRSSS